MDLNLSNRGLFSFDAALARQSLLKATRPPNGSSNAAAASVENAIPAIRQLNLSFNSLHIFTGGEMLKGLTVLDLSHNELAQLRGHSLPATLVKLNLSHNRLAQLTQLADCTPRLEVLDVSHNQLSAAALQGLPALLVQLNVKNNSIESLTPFSTLLHLSKLNVAQNRLESSDTLQSLHPLMSLRFLDVRGNPFCEDSVHSFHHQDNNSYRKNSNISSSSGLIDSTKGEEQKLLSILSSVVPRLSHFNGQPLSQAPANRTLKHVRKEQTRTHERSASTSRDASRSGIREFHRSDSSHQRSVREAENGDVTEKSHLSSSRDGSVARPALEVRLMLAKVSELRRLLLAAQDAESKARQERTLLTENVKSTSLVMIQQRTELEKLQRDVTQLRAEQRKLRVPIAAAEESFEQVHASLLATKAKASAVSLK